MDCRHTGLAVTMTWRRHRRRGLKLAAAGRTKKDSTRLL
jgi:hypothetical protein